MSLLQRPLPDKIQHSQDTDIHVPGGIRTDNLNRQAAADPHLRPRGHWNRLKADSHIAYRAHAAPMLFPWRSPAMPCRAPTLLRQYRVLVKVRVVAGNILTASPTV